MTGSPGQLLAVALVVLAVAAAGWLPVPPYYLTNDDVAMRLLAEGRFAPGTPASSFLMFMNIGVGWLLASLYEWAPVVPWYDLLMLVTALVASAALTFVWTSSGDGTSFFRALILGGLFLVPVFATPQFSLAGMTSAAAGLTLLARALALPLSAVARRRHLVSGTTLFVWGALIRWEAAGLLLCQAMLSCAATGLFRKGAGSGRIPPVLRAFTIATLLLGISVAVHMAAYRWTPGWKHFSEFNLTRARLTEYASTAPASSELLSALRTSTGWSPNDLQLLRDWFFVDASVFSLDKLRAASTVFGKKTDPISGPPRAAIAGALGRLATAIWPALLILGMIAVAASPPLARLTMATILVVTFFLLAFLVTVVLKELPFRIYWPMLVFVAGLLFIPDSPQRLRPRAAVALLAATVLLAIVTVGRGRDRQAHEAAARAVAADVAALGHTDAELVIIHADALRWEFFWRPFGRRELGMPFLGIGVSAQTPPIQNALQRLADGDIVHAMCGNERFLLLARPSLPPALSIFMAEHHARTVRFEPVLEGRTFIAWRCRSG